jgi:hypothetical protein
MPRGEAPEDVVTAIQTSVPLQHGCGWVLTQGKAGQGVLWSRVHMYTCGHTDPISHVTQEASILSFAC